MGTTNLIPIQLVAPSTMPMVVNLYKSDGSTAAAASTAETGGSAVTFPLTVSAAASSTIYVFDDQSLVVSAKVAGVEVAGGYLSTWAGTVSGGGVRLAPAAPASTDGGAYAGAQSINAQTGTTYTLVSTDAGKLVTLSNASAITLTVPRDSAATIPVGSYVELVQLGAGQVTVAAGSGATLRVGGLTAKARAQYSSFGVQKIAADTWRLYGDLAAS